MFKPKSLAPPGKVTVPDEIEISHVSPRYLAVPPGPWKETLIEQDLIGVLFGPNTVIVIVSTIA